MPPPPCRLVNPDGPPPLNALGDGLPSDARWMDHHLDNAKRAAITTPPVDLDGPPLDDAATSDERPTGVNLCLLNSIHLKDYQ